LRKELEEVAKSHCGIAFGVCSANSTLRTKVCIALLPRKHQFKNDDQHIDYWDYTHRLGALEGPGPLWWPCGPGTPEFFAQSKMRPNEVLPEFYIFVHFLQREAL
jgi:hypothetical protein